MILFGCCQGWGFPFFIFFPLEIRNLTQWFKGKRDSICPLLMSCFILVIWICSVRCKSAFCQSKHGAHKQLGCYAYHHYCSNIQHMSHILCLSWSMHHQKAVVLIPKQMQHKTTIIQFLCVIRGTSQYKLSISDMLQLYIFFFSSYMQTFVEP